MSDRPPNAAKEHADDVFDRAQHWEERLPHADRVERALFVRWLKAGREHLGAMFEMDSLRAKLSPDERAPRPSAASILAQVREVNAEEDEELAAAAAVSLTPAGSETPAPAPARRSRWRARPLLSAAAAVASLTLLAGAGWLIFGGAGTEEYSTAVGELRSFQLADGSIIELNAASRVRVAYSVKHRNIELLEGEALFKVAHAPQRPFVVACAGTQVRALGTEFRVTQYPHSIAVRVLEGTVGISDPDHPGQQPVTRGQAASISSVGGVITIVDAPVTPSEKANDGLWRVHSEPLQNIAARMNRFNKRPKIRVDTAAGEMLLTGIYDLRSAASFVTVLEHTPGLQIEPGAADEVIVHAAAAPATAPSDAAP